MAGMLIQDAWIHGGGKRDDTSTRNYYNCVVGSKYMSLRVGGMSGPVAVAVAVAVRP